MDKKNTQYNKDINEEEEKNIKYQSILLIQDTQTETKEDTAESLFLPSENTSNLQAMDNNSKDTPSKVYTL